MKAETRFRIPDKHLGYLYIAPALLFIACVIFLPMIETVGTSFTRLNYRARATEFVGLENYGRLLGDPLFWLSLKNTFVFAIGSTVGHVVLGTFFAVLLSARWASDRVRNIVRGLLILPWLFSLAAAALIWGLLYDPYGPLNYLLVVTGIAPETFDFLGEPGNAMASLIVINIRKFYPFYMVMILGGLQSIPEELYEAARIDGATTAEQFWYVTLPMLRPVLVAATTIDMITTFATFDLVKIMTNGGPQRSTQTLSLYIYETGFRDVNLGYGAAMAVAMLVILALATALYIRIFLKSKGGSGDAGF
ncbi:MAG: sugar ABC transporter permease [Rhodospirillales bacterium]|nr:sugar ABC transporter permease [Rhodospirillales bacterium]